MKTITEKYHAVNEGAMSKAEFVRQMRLAHPQVISQFNGFNDSVQILKNKGLLFEKKRENEYENPSYNLSPDAVRRGLRYELILAGLDPAGDISEEDYMKAHKKAEDNIMKDQLHYYRMIADDKTKIEHDKMKETKRGAQETDTDNAMAKVKLNENVSKKQSIKESKIAEQKALLENAIHSIKQVFPELTKEIFKAYIDTHYTDLLNDPSINVADDFMEWAYINGYMDTRPDSLDETESTINEGRGDLETIIDAIDNHAEYSTDGNDIEEAFEEIFAELGDHYGYDISFTPRANKNKSEAKGKDHDGDGDIDSDDYMAAKDKAIKKAMGKDVNEAEEKIKRALKKKIVQILNEGSLNEADTKNLNQVSEEEPDYKKGILELEDIVTEIEKFKYTIQEKIQNTFDKMKGTIDSETGLNRSPFALAKIEGRFRKDLQQVVPPKQPFIGKIDTGSVRRVKTDPNTGDVYIAEQEPKETVFNENKKTK